MCKWQNDITLPISCSLLQTPFSMLLQKHGIINEYAFKMQIKQSAPLDWNKKRLIFSHTKTRKVYFIIVTWKVAEVILPRCPSTEQSSFNLKDLWLFNVTKICVPSTQNRLVLQVAWNYSYLTHTPCFREWGNQKSTLAAECLSYYQKRGREKLSCPLWTRKQKG